VTAANSSRIRPRSARRPCAYRPAIAATNSSRAAMLIRIILSPADEHRSGVNQMRQHLSFPRGRRRWPDRSSGRSDNYLGDLGLHCWPPPPVPLANPPFPGWKFLTDLGREGSIVAALGTRKVRFRREPAVRCVFIDRLGEFAGLPREQLFPRQSCLFRQSF